jgi:hypothetical protein
VLLIALLQIALVISLITLAVRLVNAAERIDRSISRAVARYARTGA